MKYIVPILAVLSTTFVWIWYEYDRMTACWIDATNETDAIVLLFLHTEPDAGESPYILSRNRPKRIRLNYPVETKVYFMDQGETFTIFEQCRSAGDEMKLKFKGDGSVEIRNWWR